MDSQLRVMAALQPGSPTAVLNARAGAAVPIPNPTIAPFDHGLNGVNQANNMLFSDILWWSMGAIGLMLLVFRLLQLAWEKLRHVSTMNFSGSEQAYWKKAQWSWMPALKKHLIYAPLWKKRHTREFRLSSAVNVGTVPLRFQAIVLFSYLASNLAYMFVLNWGNLNKYELSAEIRGRSGSLALVNMVPLLIYATRNNPLIPILNVSFDTYNLFHRWMGRVVVLEVVIHFIAWAFVQVADGGWESVQDKILHDRFITSGTVGTAALVIIFIAAVGPVRHAFYETFVTTHIMLAFVVFVTTWVHCVSAQLENGLPQTPWIITIMVLWAAERMARMLRLVYCNWSNRGFTEATIEALPCEATRVTMRLARYVDVHPGQHAYLRFAGINPWENHPFSIAHVEHHDDNSLPISEKEAETVQHPTSTSVSFIIGAHTGFTRKLYDTAMTAKKSGLRTLKLRAALEGPYAGHDSLDSYGHCVLIAGATGISHQLSYLPHLLKGCDEGTVATRRITLIWVIRDYDAIDWITPFMVKIMPLRQRHNVLRIKFFVTRPKASESRQPRSSTIEIFTGRPNIPTLLEKEVREQQGAMAVSVCGPGALQDDVRDAVRNLQDEQNELTYYEESYTW
ncbi:ferric reductase like transmembrane component-domain-containing protein [Podospora didyma]|uniref:Ferric reductase like transmembrane component-domain-containing protein n=1 Tax=Podospora didyma TaxID=330526 RepID=A0AAE0P497_9PEZI|nr:ferric reductase like transmembrane component-domain-containing protein [Podospora didyma]